MFETFENYDGTWSLYESDHLIKDGFKSAEEALKYADEIQKINSLKNK